MADDLRSYSFPSTPSPDELAAYPLNDLGNGKRMMRLAGAQENADGTWEINSAVLLQQRGAGWTGFNDKYWDQENGENLARLKAHAVASAMAPLYKPISEAWPLEKHPDIVKYQRSLGSSGATAGLLRQAESYLTVKIDAFDRDPMALNCQNGTLKLRLVGGKLERRLFPHDPRDRITKIAAVDYDPPADCHEFKAVWRHSFQRSAEERDYFRRCCGYAVTGSRAEQAFFVCQGKGRDGKSTLLDAIRQTLGSYASTGDVQTFLESGATSSSGPTPDLVRLSGDRRYIVLAEPKKGAAWHEGKLKAWTSGAPITARDLNQGGIEFTPTGKLFVECNNFPRPKSDDDGFWRRIKLILFRHQVPTDKVDMDLPERIAARELPGILNWLLDGLEDYLAGGLRTPDTLKHFSAAYRTSASPLLDWLTECAVWGDDAGSDWVAAKDLRTSLNDWWDEQGHDPQKRISMRALGDFLTDRQIGTKRSRTGNVYRGPMRLKKPFERDQVRAGEEQTSGADYPPGAGGQWDHFLSGNREPGEEG